MIFGIDYGTTHSSIAVFQNGNIHLLKHNNTVKFDSTIYEKDNIYYFNKQYNFNKITKIKRYINKINMDTEDVDIIINDKTYKLSILINKYFDFLLSIIKINFPSITDIKVVLTVPSYFNHHHRNFLKNILINKNVDVIRILSEPSSAVLSYYYYYPDNINKVITFDEGGGTLDISVLEKMDDFYQVIDHEGDLYLGGEDFTKDIMDFYNISWNEAENIKLLNDKEHIISYSNSLNKIKNILSNLQTRHNFEDIDNIIMVGNGSKLQAIIDILQDLFPNKIKQSIQQDNLVVLGAAYYGALLNKDKQLSTDIILLDSTPLSIGIETKDLNFSVIIPKNSILPAIGYKKYLPTDDDDNITLKIFQGERGLAQDNSLIEIIEVPANPNVFIDSIYKITLKLDLNGIIYIRMEDVNDRHYLHERILKHKKIDDVDKFLKNKLDIEKANIRSNLYIIKQIISRIKHNLQFTKLDDDEKTFINNQFHDILNEIDNNQDILLILKYKKIIEDKYGHLQYIQKKDDIVINDEDYSLQWKKDFLFSKLKSFLDIINLSDSISELINSTLNNKDINVNELEDIISQIENIQNYNNHFEETKDLIYYLEYSIENDELDISKDNIHLLTNEINKIKTLFDDDNINWEDILNDFNEFCSNLT